MSLYLSSLRVTPSPCCTLWLHWSDQHGDAKWSSPKNFFHIYLFIYFITTKPSRPSFYWKLNRVHNWGIAVYHTVLKQIIEHSTAWNWLDSYLKSSTHLANHQKYKRPHKSNCKLPQQLPTTLQQKPSKTKQESSTPTISHHYLQTCFRASANFPINLSTSTDSSPFKTINWLTKLFALCSTVAGSFISLLLIPYRSSFSVVLKVHLHSKITSLLYFWQVSFIFFSV